MTKLRAPLSIDAALARIAGQVDGGWKAMADLVGKAERTVRKWGDEDADEEINLKAAIALDIAYQRAGGEGRPLYDTYGLMVGVALADRFIDQFEIMRRAARLVKETGEAESALLRYTLPDATDADRREAQREILEAMDAMKHVLPLLETIEARERAPP